MWKQKGSLRGEIYKTNCHGQEKEASQPRSPFIMRQQIGGWTTPADRHSPDLFTHSPSAPHRDLPPRFDTVLKVIPLPPFHLPVVVPSLPATASAVTVDGDSLFLPPYDLSRFFANEYNRANTSYALYYRVCLSQR